VSSEANASEFTTQYLHKDFFGEKLVGLQTLLVYSNKRLTGICHNKSYF